MNNKKIIVLGAACALALSLGLTACGGSDKEAASGAVSSGAASSGVVSEVIDEEIMNQPASMHEAPVEEMPAVSMPTVDAETGEQTNKPEEKPAEKPEAKPEVKPESKPEAKPETKPETAPETKPETSTPAASNVSASEVAAKVEAAMGELPGLMELDAEMLNAMYGLDASLLEGYVCKMPMMMVHATEYFVAQVKDGNMDTVKAGVEKRLADLDMQWKQYLPDQYELVQNAKVVTSGNYIALIIGNQAAAAADAFTGAIG